MFAFRGSRCFQFAASVLTVAALVSISCPSVWANPRAARAQAQARARAVSNLGTVKAAQRQVHAIAIPMFRPDAATARQVPAGSFQKVIAADLQVTGLFRLAADGRQMEAAHTAWAGNPRDFGPWRSIGAAFFCSASYKVDANGRLSADARVYDTTSGQRVFGRRYARGFTAARPDRLAHKIADDIIAHIAQEEGVSSTFLAFVSSRQGNKEVFVMDANGQNQAQLTREDSLVAAPTWGARGGEIYYTTYRRHNPDLVGVTLDGRKRWAISEHSGNNISADWSERRGLLAVTLGKDGNQEIYVMDRGGTNPRRLTRGKAIDSAPVWSPDGSRMAFVSNRGGGPQIYVMGADGSGVRRASFVSDYATSPAWSPDGSRLAFVGRVQGRHQIFVLDLATAKARQLTRGGGDNEDPAWAPNGQALAFASNRSGRFQVYRMRADGTNIIQLTNQGENTSPAWSPQPMGATGQ